MKTSKEMSGKRFFFLLACCLLLCEFLTSCSTTPITEIPEVEDYQVTSQAEKSSLEFIGFKMDPQKLIYDQLVTAKSISATDDFKKLGYNLEKNNFGIDKSNLYFGLYDVQEFQNYKNKKRFITFVDIEYNSLKYEISGKFKWVWATLSGLSFGSSLGLLKSGTDIKPQRGSPGYSALKKQYETYITAGLITSLIGAGFLIPALKTPKTTATFNGTYNIYVYDTQTQSIIRRETISIKETAEFKGVYTANQESQDKVMEYYSKLISNKILQKYEEIALWLNNIE